MPPGYVAAPPDWISFCSSPPRSDPDRATADPDGGIAHLTWWDGADCHNLDAWDSKAC
jgi:hypothetical protein